MVEASVISDRTYPQSIHYETPLAFKALEQPTTLASPRAISINPLAVNVRRWVPPVGVVTALLWGVASVIEHRVQAGRLPMGVAGRVMALVARLTPVINVGYGATNALGAAANGYAWRTLAFALYGLFSTLTAPLIMRDTGTTLKWLASRRAGDLCAARSLGAVGQKLRPGTALINHTNPIGLMLGLLTISASAQAKPGLSLKQPQGDSLAEMINQPSEPLGEVLPQNLKTETRNWVDLLSRLPQRGLSLIKSFRQGVKALLNPEPSHNGSAWQRLTDPMINSDGVAFLCALTAASRLGAALIALIIGLRHAGALVKQSPFGHGKAPMGPKWVASGSKLLNATLLIGQFMGGLAALLTRFNGWPVQLSIAYRVSSLPFILSGLSSLIKKPIAGFETTAWAKIGGFIQSSSYFGSVWLSDKPIAKDKNLS